MAKRFALGLALVVLPIGVSAILRYLPSDGSPEMCDTVRTRHVQRLCLVVRLGMYMHDVALTSID